MTARKMIHDQAGSAHAQDHHLRYLWRDQRAARQQGRADGLETAGP